MSERGRRTEEEEAECRRRNSKVSLLVSLSDSLCHDQYMPPVVSWWNAFVSAAQALSYPRPFHFGRQSPICQGKPYTP